MIDVCRTRWIARIDGLDRIIELFNPILATLEDIRLNRNDGGDAAGTGNWNSNSRDDAQALSNAVNFQFIISLVIVRYILDLTRPVTVKLQREEMDILKAEQEISNLKDALNDFREDINAEHSRLYEEAVQLAGGIGIEPSQPRTVQRQVHRDNAPAISPNQYYRINLTRVFLDHAVQQLDSRFPPEAYTCYKGMSIVPAVLLNNLPSWKANVHEFCDDYPDDIPNAVGLHAELELWQRMWMQKRDEFFVQRQENVPEKISETLKVVDPPSFPNVFAILQILATIPVTSCSCERSISSLRHLKNYLRGTMGQERLNGLALMHAHREIPLDLDEIIDSFARKHPRRMRMVNILCGDGPV